MDFIAFYMISSQMLASLFGEGTLYKEGMVTFYISKYNSYLTEYEHNKKKLKDNI